MTAKTYLRKVIWLQVKIDQRKFQLSTMSGNYDYIHGMNYHERVQTSPRDALGDTVARELDRLESLRCEIVTEIGSFETLRDRIIRQIRDVQSHEQADLLFRRYVEGHSFERIAVDMGYSYGYIRNLHGTALSAFASQYSETLSEATE